MPDAPKPKRTGTIFRYVPAKQGEKLGHYVVRCSAPDGSRPLFHLDPSAESPKARAAALHTAEGITERLWEQRLGATPARQRAKRSEVTPGMVTAARDWWDRFFKHRDALGMGSVAGIYKTHIRPVIDVPWVDVTAADCERLRDELDAKVTNETITDKTAFNAWTVFRTASKAASGRWSKDKRHTLKQRDGDPSDGVVGPDYDADEGKQLQWLYPREVLAIAACPSDRVPLHVRRRIVLAAYLCVRGGELKALTWSKIDLERGVVIVDEAYDRERKVTKRTKTGNRGARRYSIEPTLLPLLRALHAESGGSGPVMPMPLQKLWAVELRDALGAAEVQRPELFTTTKASKRVRFHDLRASGLTWMAIRGDSPVQIQHVGGHTDFATTKKYIDAAGAVDLLPGEVVFPELPADLLKAEPTPTRARRTRPQTPAALSQGLSQAPQVLDIIVEAPGIEFRSGLLQKPKRVATFHVLRGKGFGSVVPLRPAQFLLLPPLGPESRHIGGTWCEPLLGCPRQAGFGRAIGRILGRA